jgi:hypothetical protein
VRVRPRQPRRVPSRLSCSRNRRPLDRAS